MARAHTAVGIAPNNVSSTGSSRWDGSTTQALDDMFAVEVAGLSPSPSGNNHTCHCRVLQQSRAEDSEMVCSPPPRADPFLRVVLRGVLEVVWDSQSSTPSKPSAHDSCEMRPGATDTQALLLLRLGSVWVLPDPSSQPMICACSSLKGLSLSKKPKARRMTEDEATFVPEGGWLGFLVRVHHSPCRCEIVHQLDWSKPFSEEGGAGDGNLKADENVRLFGRTGKEVKPSLPGVIVYEVSRNMISTVFLRSSFLVFYIYLTLSISEGVKHMLLVCDLIFPACTILQKDPERGYAILNKPGGVPVHATVYNGVENVLWMFRAVLAKRRQRKNLSSEADDGSNDAHDTSNRFGSAYISLPQRLDNDTSGLLIVSTKKEFATYMARLLQNKTEMHLLHDRSQEKKHENQQRVTKTYKCLVCLKLATDADRLGELAESGQIVTHYLDPCATLPRIFADNPPSPSEIGSSKWRKCQLCISRVGTGDKCDTDTVRVLECSKDSELARQLWDCSGGEKISLLTPFSAVTEVEVELLTGRTHQIRGQLSALGFPIVGDSLYGGGATICDSNGIMRKLRSRLALHCCELSFNQPDLICQAGERMILADSGRKNTFRQREAWWSKHCR